MINVICIINLIIKKSFKIFIMVYMVFKLDNLILVIESFEVFKILFLF